GKEMRTGKLGHSVPEIRTPGISLGQHQYLEKNILRTRTNRVQCPFWRFARQARGPARPGAQSLLAPGNPVIRSTIPMSATSQAALRLVEGSSMDKSKALDAALSQIERNFGKGSIMRLGKSDKSMDVETISSGSLGLDIALGVGGLP